MNGLGFSLRATFFTLLAVEAALIVASLARAETRRDPVTLFFFVAALALDELAPPGIVGAIASCAVPLAAGTALAPGHRTTRLLYVAGALGVLTAVGLWLAGVRDGAWFAVPVSAVLCLLSLHPVLFVLSERTWMGSGVLLAVVSGGLLWLAGRLTGIAAPALRFPVPGLPFALVAGVGLVRWWLASDGPVAGRWFTRASLLEGRLANTESLLRVQDRLSALGFMAAGAAHEFRSALASIGNLGQWGRRSASVDTKDAAFDAIAERVRDSSASVATLLDRLSAEGREQPRPIRLWADLDRLLGFVRATCRREEIVLGCEAEGDPKITARIGEIEHILLNLLHNAVRALGAQPHAARRLLLRAARTAEGRTVLEVQDTGGGVPAEVLNSLFTPISSGAEGTGLGLFLARGLAERNCGRLEYESIPGGSLFRVVFDAGVDEERGAESFRGRPRGG